MATAVDPRKAMRGWSTAHRDFELDLYWTHTPSVGGVGGVGVACDLSPAEQSMPYP